MIALERLAGKYATADRNHRLDIEADARAGARFTLLVGLEWSATHVYRGRCSVRGDEVHLAAATHQECRDKWETDEVPCDRRFVARVLEPEGERLARLAIEIDGEEAVFVREVE